MKRIQAIYQAFATGRTDLMEEARASLKSPALNGSDKQINWAADILEDMKSVICGLLVAQIENGIDEAAIEANLKKFEAWEFNAADLIQASKNSEIYVPKANVATAAINPHEQMAIIAKLGSIRIK